MRAGAIACACLVVASCGEDDDEFVALVNGCSEPISAYGNVGPYEYDWVVLHPGEAIIVGNFWVGAPYEFQVRGTHEVQFVVNKDELREASSDDWDREFDFEGDRCAQIG